jgi:hypothetical protein
VHRLDPVGDQRHPGPLAAAARELRLLGPEEDGRGRVGHRRHQRLEEPAERRSRVAAGDGLRAVGDRGPQAAVVDAAGATVEVGVGEAVRLQMLDQLPAAQLDPRGTQPAVEQQAGVVGTDVGGDLALPGGALAHRPLGDLQHRGRIWSTPCRGRSVERQGAGGEHDRGVRPLGGAALRAEGLGPAGAQVAQKLFRRGCRGRLGEGAPDVHAGVIVGAADSCAAVRLDVDDGGSVQLRRSRAVADLPDREELGEAAALPPGQRRGHVVEGVRESAGNPVLVKVCGAGLEIAGVGLQPLVVPGIDPVTEDVHRLGLAGEAGGQLLGDEAVGTAGQLEAAVDRVVVGDGHEVHPAPLRQLVDLPRRGGALGQAKRALDSETRELRGGGMAMQIDPGSHRCLPLLVRCHLQILGIAGKTCEPPDNGR